MRLLAILVLAMLTLPPWARAAAQHDGQTFGDCADCPQMAVIPGGTFTMGSPASERGRFNSEGPQHRVAVRPFALGVYDVTVGQFADFVRQAGYQAGTCQWPQDSTWHSEGFAFKDPVVCISWNDAQAYISWLNAKVGGSRDGPYRLPSEAEWEYAARAGTETARWWGEDIGRGHADCNGCGSRWDNSRLSPVGSFPPNPFGLYDMLGDVWQWTQDCWNENYVGAPRDGSPWLTGDCARRVLRGGSWSNLPAFIRSAARSRDLATARASDYATYAGFRVARTVR